jgi:hypothetical protein
VKLYSHIIIYIYIYLHVCTHTIYIITYIHHIYMKLHIYIIYIVPQQVHGTYMYHVCAMHTVHIHVMCTCVMCGTHP